MELLHTQSTLPLSLKPPHTHRVLLLLQTPSQNHTFSLSPQLPSLRCTCTRRTTTGYRNSRRRRWRPWLDDVTPVSKPGYGVVDEILDNIFIFKVFRFYGWWLSPVIISMLLATGLKAFLLALAVPVGLSIVALPFNKLWDTINDSKRGSRANKRKPRGRSISGIDTEKDWVPNDDGKIDEGVEDLSRFKGWDDLDRVKEFDEERMKRDKKGGRSRREGRYVRKERGVEIPLLLRLLIAVFPFLGSWTNMM